MHTVNNSIFASTLFSLLFVMDVHCEFKNSQIAKLLKTTEFNIHPAQIHVPTKLKSKTLLYKDIADVSRLIH